MICPVCHEEVEGKKIDGRGVYTLFLCSHCEAVFSQPMRSPGAEWYENAKKYTMDRFIVSGKPTWYHRQFLRANAEGKGKRLLDVGCGLGQFMSESKRLGFAIYGIDFDQKNLQIAKKKFGLSNIYQMTIEEFRAKGAGIKFDFITFFEVLEHLDNPVVFLTELKRLLKPDGRIALSVPNRDRIVDSLGEGDYPPNHLTRWNKKAIYKFLENNGFEVRKFIAKNFAVDDLIDYLKLKSKLGLAEKLVSRAKPNEHVGAFQIAKILIRLRETFFSCLKLSLWLFLFPITALGIFADRGTSLYCEAALKKRN